MVDEILRDFEICGIKVTYIGTEDPEEEGITYCGFTFDDSYVELYNSVWKFELKGNEIYVREGTWFEKDEDTCSFEPDWSLTWLYTDENDPSDYLYYESDGVEVSIYNFIRSQMG